MCVLLSKLDPFLKFGGGAVPVPDPYEFRLTADSITAIEMVPGQEIYFRDSGGLTGNYENSKFYRQPFQAPNGFRITSVDFEMEASSYAMYDRIGLQSSVDGGNTWQNISIPWLQKSATTVMPWSSSFAGSSYSSSSSKNGYIWPLNPARALILDPAYTGIFELAFQDIRFVFSSDSSVPKPGWDITVEAM